ncbi:MAG: hypothetical protein M1815_003435 [Lichina confinis]|nr:MAG: hypothetical protein M1815_003435 [Lichina confinis]
MSAPLLTGVGFSTLVYSCVCKNGQSPNASEYSQTIPYYICTEANTQCVDDCGNNAACQSACREDNPCGAQNPTPANKTASSTRSATATSSDEPSSTDGDEVFDGFAGAAGSPSGSSSGNTNINAGSVAIDLGRSFGLGAVALGIFAGFAIVL